MYLGVCIYVCVYVCMYACIHVSVRTCAYKLLQIAIFFCFRQCTNLRVYVYMLGCNSHVFVCMICTCVYTHVYCTYTYDMHTHTLNIHEYTRTFWHSILSVNAKYHLLLHMCWQEHTHTSCSTCVPEQIVSSSLCAAPAGARRMRAESRPTATRNRGNRGRKSTMSVCMRIVLCGRVRNGSVSCWYALRTLASCPLDLDHV